MIQKRLSVYWMSLSFVSGLINSAGFVLFAVYLTHMTGVFSKIGLEAEQLHGLEFLKWLAIPATFVVGSMLSTIFIEGQAHKTHNPRYEWAFGSLAFLMIFVGTGLNYGIQPQWCLLIIALAAGMQNAIFNERTGAIIRSTHMTGTTTDLGIGLARIWFKTLGKSPQSLAREQHLVALRFLSIFFFIIGSVVGALLTFSNSTPAFFLAAAMYAILGVDSAKVLKLLHATKN